MYRCVFLLLIAMSNLFGDTTEGNIFFSGFARSGNNWTKYCLQALTQRELRTGSPNNHQEKFYPLLQVDKTKVPIYFTHASYMKLSENDKFILIIRNYKECMLRNFGDRAFSELSQKGAIYFSNLDSYDKWDPEKRLLIYYESFMRKPRRTLKRMMKFLGENPTKVDEFMKKYSVHQNASLYFDRKYQYTSEVKEKDMLYFSKKLPLESLIEFDEFVKDNHPELWNKYLCRYESKAKETPNTEND